MTTENDKLHETIADSEKLIKSGENSLKQMDKIRKELGLSVGASKEFLEHIPSSSEKNRKAQKELKQFMDSVDDSEQGDDSKSKKKSKRRSRLAKAMNKKLRI